MVIPEISSTTTTVASSLNPSNYGQSITFTASVVSTVSTSFTPTGTVTFYDGASLLGTDMLNSNATATLTTSSIVAGANSIIAQYDGDSNFSGSNSLPLIQIVGQDATSTVVVSSLSTSTYGQSVTFTATVAAAAPGSGTPTGTVVFYDDSTALGPATLTNGTAILTTAALVAGSYSITAQYGGDANFTGSTSAAVTQVVNQDGSTTIVTSSLNPSISSQPVTLTATVSASAPGSGTPTGSVTFYDSSYAIDTETLSGAQPALPLPLLPSGVTRSLRVTAEIATSPAAPHQFSPRPSRDPPTRHSMARCTTTSTLTERSKPASLA